MALVEIRGGAKIDIPNVAEIEAIIGAGVGPEARQGWWDEQAQIETARELQHARGVKFLRRDSSLASPAQTRVTLQDAITPDQGFVWSVRLLSAQLASSSSLQAFITSDTSTGITAAAQRRLVAATTSNAQYVVITFPQASCLLEPGEGLFLNAGANIQSYFVSGWIVPAEMAWKLL